MPIKPAPAVLRAMSVLEFLALDPKVPPTLSEIARRTGQSKATCSSVLVALAEGGYVHRDPESLVYSLGPGLIGLGAAASTHLQLPVAARAEMEAVGEFLGVTTVAAVAAGTNLLVVATLSPPQSFQVSLPVGQMVPFAPPLGAAFIAWSPQWEIDAWLDRSPIRLTDEQRLHYGEALAAVRELGFSVTLRGPVRDGGRAEAGVELSLPPSQRMREFGHASLPTKLVEGRSYRLTQLSAPVFDSNGAVRLVLLGVAVGLELPAGEIVLFGQRLVEAAARLQEAVAFSTGPV